MLSVLFASFPAAETLSDDMRQARVRAYLMAVQGFSPDVLKWATSEIINGRAGLDKRFMPTPPQLRELCDKRQSQIWRANMPVKPPDYSRYDVQPSEAQVSRVQSVIRNAAKNLDSGGGFPSLLEMKSWQMPAGSVVSARDGTVAYPNGGIETWGEIRRRLKGATWTAQ